MKLDLFFPQKSSLLSFSDIWNFVCSIVFTADVIHFHYFDIMFSTEVSGFFISSFISLYSLSELFIETNSSWLIYESINDLEIRASIVCNFLFSSNTILPCFFLYNWVISFNSCRDCTNFCSYCRTCNTIRNTN